MKTAIYQINQIQEISQVIKAGGLVAIPPDTAYGIAVNRDDFKALENLKTAKGRPEEKPFPMMVSSVEQLETVAVVTEKQRKVINRFMPGALTIIFRKQSSLSDIVTNGFSTVGIRMPDDKWVLELIDLVCSPLLVPSANLSGEPSCTNHRDVLSQLDGRIDAVVTGESGTELSSTVVDMSDDTVKILREGVITLDDIMEVVK